MLDDLDLFGERIRPRPDSVLAQRFIVPPFSVLNAREGGWQERKRQWLALGIRSELGRGESLQEMAATDLGGGLKDTAPLPAKQGGRACDAIPGGAGRGSVMRNIGKYTAVRHDP